MNRKMRRRSMLTHREMLRLPCTRCGAPQTADTRGWNLNFDKGVLREKICPDCQTPLESLEAEVKLAMLDYSVNAAGQLVTAPKIAPAILPHPSLAPGCVRCGVQPANSPQSDDWQGLVQDGEVVALICGSCTTPAESAECAPAEVDSSGRLHVWPDNTEQCGS